MKMAQEPNIELLYKYTKLSLYIDNKDRQMLMQQFKDFRFDGDADYEIEVKKKRKRKTKDQNAYVWELMGKLAEKLHISSEEVYREIMYGMSKYDVVPIKEENIENYIKAWESGHVGRVCEDLGECKNFKGYHNIVAHYGISDYNTAEMSHFIDLVIQECQQQGIPTLTPQEIARLNLTEER